MAFVPRKPRIRHLLSFETASATARVDRECEIFIYEIPYSPDTSQPCEDEPNTACPDTENPDMDNPCLENQPQ